jgi:hypothetical protein
LKYRNEKRQMIAFGISALFFAILGVFVPLFGIFISGISGFLSWMSAGKGTPLGAAAVIINLRVLQKSQTAH